MCLVIGLGVDMQFGNQMKISNNLIQEHLHHPASSAYSAIASTSFPGRPKPSILIVCYSGGSLTGKNTYYDREGIYQRRTKYVCVWCNVLELLLTASGAMNRPVTVTADMPPDGLTLSS